MCFSGEKYNKPPVINFEAIFDTSSPNVPIVFILSPGTEPANDLMKLADRVGMGTSKLKMLAMGQGQEKVFKRSFCFHSIHMFYYRKVFKRKLKRVFLFSNNNYSEFNFSLLIIIM